MSLLRAPQRHPLRRALWQIHVWTGVAVAAYAALLGVTGAVLVFRPELQARMYPAFFARWAPGDALAPPEAVIAALRARYPDDRFRGLDYPHARRGTFLIYTSHAGELRTVFADARTGRVIGELPRDGDRKSTRLNSSH